MVTARTGLLLSMFLLFAACAPERAAVTPPSGAEARLADTDWTQAQRIDVTLDEFAFAPEEFALEEGRPYRLHLRNVGGVDHTFTSPSFFSAVAVRPDGAGAASAPTGTIEVAAGEAVDLYVLPLRSGHYPFWCDEFLHDSFGMEGDAVVR